MGEERPVGVAEASVVQAGVDEGAEPLTLDEILGLIHSAQLPDRLDGLAELSALVDSAYDREAAELGEAVREAGGVQLLCWLAMDVSSVEVQQRALLVLGNLCSDATDPHSSLTKSELLRSGGVSSLVLAVMSEHAEVVLYACGCLQNLCHDDEWAHALAGEGVQQRLEQLITHENAHVVHYAAGALKNMLMHVHRTSGGDELDGLSAAARTVVWERGRDAMLESLRHRRAMRLLREWVRRIPPEKRLQRLLKQRFNKVEGQASPGGGSGGWAAASPGKAAAMARSAPAVKATQSGGTAMRASTLPSVIETDVDQLISEFVGASERVGSSEGAIRSSGRRGARTA